MNRNQLEAFRKQLSRLPASVALQRGYSLIEMTIALLVTSAIMSVLVVLMHSATTLSTGDVASANAQAAVIASLGSTKDALVGYSLASFSFPLPDPASGLTVGSFASGQVPADKLGLPEAPRVYYAIDPRLLSSGNYVQDPDGVTQGNLPTRVSPGMPDLCEALANVQRAPTVTVNNVPVALVLAAAGNGAQLAINGVPLPDSPAGLQLAGQGVQLAEFGAAELAGAINCPRYAGRLAAAAVSVAAAGDMNQWSSLLVQFRNLQSAEAQQALFSLAMKLALTLTTIAILGTDASSTEIEIALSEPDLRQPTAAANYALQYVGLEILLGYLAAMSVQTAYVLTWLQGLPDGTAAAATAQQQAGTFSGMTAAALADAQNRYTWALMGL